jgi:HTH-type transcriptional regulator, sugar sensing transcriptional regulator
MCVFFHTIRNIYIIQQILTKIMEIEKKLESLGLTSTESKLYITLLQVGSSSAVQLAKETSIHRRTIYDNLAILIKKGLVSYKLKNNVKYFEAINPNTFYGFLEEKKNTLNEILPKLINLFEDKQQTSQITIIEGIEGAKSIIEEAAKTKKQIYWMGGGLFFFDAMKFSKEFIEKKMTKMNIKIIQAKSPNIETKLKNFKKENIKLVSKKYVSKIGYTVYKDTVALGLIQEKGITTIKIVSEDFAKGFRNYFDIVWNSKEK